MKCLVSHCTNWRIICHFKLLLLEAKKNNRCKFKNDYNRFSKLYKHKNNLIYKHWEELKKKTHINFES